jgi:hypothetical protein
MPRPSNRQQLKLMGFSEPLLEPSTSTIAPIATVPAVAPKIASSAADPLDFVTTTPADAVNRINNEYFFRRDNSEICRQNARTGEIQVVSQQQLKTALAGRWVDALHPITGKLGKREAATVWLESRSRREVYGVQYCPNNIGLLGRHLNLWLGWDIDPAPGDCSVVVDHITRVIARGDNKKS